MMLVLTSTVIVGAKTATTLTPTSLMKVESIRGISLVDGKMSKVQAFLVYCQATAMLRYVFHTPPTTTNSL